MRRIAAIAVLAVALLGGCDGSTEPEPPPETVPPETVPPETVPPETVPPETAPPETAPPETASAGYPLSTRAARSYLIGGRAVAGRLTNGREVLIRPHPKATQKTVYKEVCADPYDRDDDGSRECRREPVNESDTIVVYRVGGTSGVPLGDYPTVDGAMGYAIALGATQWRLP